MSLACGMLRVRSTRMPCWLWAAEALLTQQSLQPLLCRLKQIFGTWLMSRMIFSRLCLCMPSAPVPAQEQKQAARPLSVIRQYGVNGSQRTWTLAPGCFCGSPYAIWPSLAPDSGWWHGRCFAHCLEHYLSGALDPQPCEVSLSLCAGLMRSVLNSAAYPAAGSGSVYTRAPLWPGLPFWL